MDGSAGAAAWGRIEELVARADFTALTLAVIDLSNADRPAVARALRAYVPARKYDPLQPVAEAAVAIVGAGVLPDAKSLAAWLTRWSMRHVRAGGPTDPSRWVDITVVPNVFYVLTERDVPWLADLAAQLADRLPRVADFGAERFHLVDRLLEHTGAPVPTSPGFVAGWVHRLVPGSVARELEANPGFDVLVPHFFDVEEVGATFSHDPAWPVALADVVAGGLVARDAMLDACVARLAREGRPGATRAFLATHEALAPTRAEVAARRASYLAMLEVSASTVAAAAQARLFDLDDHELLDPAERRRLVSAALARPEKKIVRAQLGRIAKRAARDPDGGVETARIVAASWAGADADVVRLGIRIIAGLRLPDSARAGVLAAAAPSLAPDLAAEFAAAVGGPVRGPSATPPRSAPVPAPGRSELPPLPDLATLEAEVLEVLAGDAADLTAARLETLVDGLLVHAARDRDALRRRIGPALRSDRFQWLAGYPQWAYDHTLRHAVWDLTVAAIGDARIGRPRERWRGPEGVLTDRLFALASLRSLPPLSVARPSWTNGLLEPDALIDRLGRAATAGWEPPPRELEQALLRLEVPDGPADRDALALAFRGLGTPAGRSAATWIGERWPATPRVECTVVRRSHTDWQDVVVDDGELVHATIIGEVPSEWPGGIWARLVQPRPDDLAVGSELRSPLCWPAVAPRHREVIAAHCVRSLACEKDSGTRLVEALPPLAESEGPMGEAMALALAYGVCAARAENRAVARQGLLVMCGRPEWDGPLFGRVLADLVTRRAVVLRRAVPPLREAAGQGAARPLWPAVQVLVAALLAEPDGPPGLADVLALGCDVAQSGGAAETIAGLAEFAARSGSSRQLVEARRLTALLSR